MANIIKSVEIIGGSNRKLIVGRTIDGGYGSKRYDLIHKIKDNCIETENSFMSMYLVYNISGDLLMSIENCPVIVTHEPAKATVGLDGNDGRNDID